MKFKEDALIKLGKGTGVPGFNRNEAYQIKIPVPPLTQQQEIIKEIEEYETEIAKHETIIAEITNKKKVILSNFLS